MGNNSSKDSRAERRQSEAANGSSIVSAHRSPPGAVPPPPSSSASSLASSLGNDSSAFPSNQPSAGGSNTEQADPHDTTPAATNSNLEPMLNFRSLAAVIGEEDKGADSSEHIEHAADTKSPTTTTTSAEAELKEPSPTNSPPPGSPTADVANRSRGDSGESSHSAPPPIYVETPPSVNGDDNDDVDRIETAPLRTVRGVDSKDINRVDVLDRGHVGHEATQ